MAIYWLLVVPPFQRVIAGHPELFEGINSAELTPREDIEGVGGGGGRGSPSPSPAPPSPPQQGTCSAKSAPVAPAKSGAQKSSAPTADDGGSQSPPSKKHKPDDPSRGPGGGAGGGNGAGGGGVAGHV